MIGPDIGRWTAMAEQFRALFGDARRLRWARAPGRVNLIGEHTDYNDGFVLPAAIDREVHLAFRRRGDRKVVLHSLNLGATGDFDLDDLERRPEQSWLAYPQGVAQMLVRAGYPVGGLEGVLDSAVPIGAGMSSSAALEVAVGVALALAGDFEVELVELAKLAQRAENEVVGVACGVMDQFISALGRAGHALLIDCRTLAYRHVPLPEDLRIVVCDSGVERGLAASAYNERRRECEAGLALLREQFPRLEALRDVGPSELPPVDRLPSPLDRRCRHVVRENERVLSAVAALEDRDLDQFGASLYASHASLRDDYEVSCPELDALVAIASETDGVIGARLTGAGFGGCTVNLVQRDAVPALVARVEAEYPHRSGRAAKVYVCRAVDGAGEI